MMLSSANVLLCAAAATAFWLCIGLPVATRVLGRAVALPCALALGWAVHNAATLPLFLLLGFTTGIVHAVNGALLILACLALANQWRSGEWPVGSRLMTLAFALAALLALAPAAAIVPKITAEGIAFAGPIFDHSKIAMIDDMARLGLPPGNPFFHEGEGPSRLAYYYLWHAGAAQFSLMTGVSGWDADAALTWVTAFASLCLMAGLAASLAGRASAAVFAVLLSATGSLRPVLEFLFGARAVAEFTWPANGFGGWLFQAAWVPQHMASASCVTLAAILLARMAARPDAVSAATLALVAAAGVGSSTWVGGVTFALAAPLVGLVLLLTINAEGRLRFVIACAAAAAIALLLALPLLKDQLLATSLRAGGSPVGLQHYEVLGEMVPQSWRRLLDIPAFWLVQLVVEFPAVYPLGAVALVAALQANATDRDALLTTRSLATLTAVSLVTSWLLVSTIGNNDLGWRAILPGIIALTIFAASGLARWIETRQAMAVVAAICALLLSLPGAVKLVRSDLAGELQPAGRAFAEEPAMWEAVRRHAAPAERVGNNPLHLQDITPWPVNLSWALFSNRRSCFASYELALAYAPLSHPRRIEIDRQFVRVFDGEGNADDVRDLATRYDCRVIVVTAQDKAWNRDPFAVSRHYRLVQSEPRKWRIYRRVEGAGS